MCKRTVACALFTLVFVTTFVSIQETPQAQVVQKGTVDTAGKSGAQLFGESCAACHGLDGKGKEATELGFDVPTPNFTDCQFAPREPNADWVTVAHEGGPVRGFSRHMPAFGGALGEADLYKIVDHIKTFCSSSVWPRGELNLPKALHTEKAFPEDEWVMTTGVGRGPANISTGLVYEKRFGRRNQIEIKLPFQTMRLKWRPKLQRRLNGRHGVSVTRTAPLPGADESPGRPSARRTAMLRLPRAPARVR